MACKTLSSQPHPFHPYVEALGRAESFCVNIYYWVFLIAHHRSQVVPTSAVTKTAAVHAFWA